MVDPDQAESVAAVPKGSAGPGLKALARPDPKESVDPDRVELVVHAPKAPVGSGLKALVAPVPRASVDLDQAGEDKNSSMIGLNT